MSYAVKMQGTSHKIVNIRNGLTIRTISPPETRGGITP
jgi:hypothetical protein